MIIQVFHKHDNQQNNTKREEYLKNTQEPYHIITKNVAGSQTMKQQGFEE